MSLDEVFLKQFPDMDLDKIYKLEDQLLYLSGINLKDKDSWLLNFFYSARVYPDLDLIKRFYHLYGMYYADVTSKKFIDEDNIKIIDFDSYMDIIDTLFTKGFDRYNNSKIKSKISKLFPNYGEEIFDDNNLKAFKLGIDEGFFLTDLDLIQYSANNFSVFNDFFDSFNPDLVGLKRFEACGKLNHVYQIINSNYAKYLSVVSNFSHTDIKMPVFYTDTNELCYDEKDSLISSLKLICDDLYLLPDADAVAYGTAAYFFNQKSLDFYKFYRSKTGFNKMMDLSYANLLKKYPELDKPYAKLRFEDMKEDFSDENYASDIEKCDFSYQKELKVLKS